jgi:hypothetical protein
MMSALKGIVVAAVVAAAVCVPIVLVMHHSLMPSPAQLSQIDDAVRSAAPAGSTVRRLGAPDQVESDGHAKFGYFTYQITEKTASERYRADWRIADRQVQLISFKRL